MVHTYVYSTGSVQFGLFSARFGSAACLGAIEGEQNNEIWAPNNREATAVSHSLPA